jgi:hypothetical protein
MKPRKNDPISKSLLVLLAVLTPQYFPQSFAQSLAQPIAHPIAQPIKRSLTQSQSAGLTIQFSKNDLASVQQGIEESLQQTPVSGVSTTPMQSPYAFGTITASDVSYQFQPSLQRLELLDSAFDLNLQIKDFRGVVGRVALNESGTMYCEQIPVHTGTDSPHNTIAVNVTASPVVASDGSLSMVIPRSEIALNDHNFMIEEPARCDVIYGLNWLIKWVVPSLIQSYKTEVAAGLSRSLADAIKNQAGSLTPLLALNVTLPFDPVTTPAFYATVGVKPQAFSITADRLQSQFATSITIDPDRMRRSWMERPDWPSNMSLVGLSWDLFDGLLREAQAKGVIKANITQKSPVGAAWIDHKRWRLIWPDLASVVPANQPLTLELLGGANYEWQAASTTPSAVTLRVRAFHGRLLENQRVLAEIFADLRLNFTLTHTESGAIVAALQSMSFERERLDLSQSPLRHLVTKMDGFKSLLNGLAADIESAPAARRELLNVTLPSLSLGSHRVAMGHLQAHAAGISLPLQYSDPQ